MLFQSQIGVVIWLRLFYGRQILVTGFPKRFPYFCGRIIVIGTRMERIKQMQTDFYFFIKNIRGNQDFRRSQCFNPIKNGKKKKTKNSRVGSYDRNSG